MTAPAPEMRACKPQDSIAACADVHAGREPVGINRRHRAKLFCRNSFIYLSERRRERHILNIPKALPALQVTSPEAPETSEVLIRLNTAVPLSLIVCDSMKVSKHNTLSARATQHRGREIPPRSPKPALWMQSVFCCTEREHGFLRNVSLLLQPTL